MRKTYPSLRNVGLAVFMLFLLAFSPDTPDPNPRRNAVYLPAVQTACTGEAVPVSLSPAPQVWLPLSIHFPGPEAEESDLDPNPFLDVRLNVTFTSPAGTSASSVTVPGFFNGDGWQVRFTPTVPGRWTWCADLRAGENVNVSVDLYPGERLYRTSGTFDVAPADPAAPGFYKWGMLEYVGSHSLKFADGPYFLKGGTNSPENWLAYEGFDNTHDQNGDFLHDYGPHGGIYGALDYLSAQGVNSIYFLPMNLGGDGQDTYPFISPAGDHEANTHYDVSKLAQWNDFFEYAIEKGISLQFVLAETEHDNATWLDDGALGVERKLFYREMVARFGHLLAVKWNLSEEAAYPPAVMAEFAAYLSALDAYDHPIGFHTHNGDTDYYQAVLGQEWMTITSVQYAPEEGGYFTEMWRDESAAAGHPWVVDMDEAWSAEGGLNCCNAVEYRKEVLWPVYVSGGNLEAFIGREDQTLENLAIYEEFWGYMRIARETVESVPFWEMQPADHLLTGESSLYGGGHVLVGAGYYLVYLPEAAGGGTLHLPAGTYTQIKINPATGSRSETTITSSGSIQITPAGGDLAFIFH